MSARELTFTVLGTPVQQGSKTVATGGGKAWLRDANGKKLKPWREHVAAEAAKHVRSRPEFPGPIRVDLVFRMPRPKRPKYPVPAVKPDKDKLERAVNDSLTAAGLIFDDSRIVRGETSKEYATEAAPPGVVITIKEIEF